MSKRREQILNTPEYWSETLQNELYNYIIEYMKENNLNQDKLAKKLNVTKGYVSQILNGNIDFRLSTIVKLCLTIGKVPNIDFQDLEEYLKKDRESLQGGRNGFQFTEYTINHCEDYKDEAGGNLKIASHINRTNNSVNSYDLSESPKVYAIAI